MKPYALRRSSDGLVIAPAVMAEPSEAWKNERQHKAALDFGGTWEWVELSADVLNQVMSHVEQKKAVRIAAGEVISAVAPTLTANKTQILANDTDSTTLTIHTNTPSYTGAARYRIVTPEGEVVTGIEICAAGTATLTLTTEQVGLHQIRVDVLDFGSADIAIEGVE